MYLIKNLAADIYLVVPMSFDTDFNYTPMVNAFTDKIKVYETMASAHSDIDDPSMQHFYDAKKKMYDDMVDRYNTTIDEIEAVEALPNEDKLTLFRFYVHSAASLQRYMRVIAHSYAAMLADKELVDLVTASIPTGNDLTVVANTIAGAKIFSKYSDSGVA